MRLHASWEHTVADPTSVQRMCSMTITGVELLRDLDVEEAGNKKSKQVRHPRRARAVGGGS